MRAVLLASLMIAAAAGPAGAAGTRCWRDYGAVVVSASLGDIAGDFVLDLATPHSLLHLTRAQSEGIDAPTYQGPLKLAGRRLGTPTFQIADLDARNWGFPTEISGVIGADALAGYTIDLSATPTCRITLWPRRAPAFGRTTRLRIRMLDGAPTVAASVSDLTTTLAGRFAIETGGEGVRLSPSVGALSRTPKGIDPASRGQPPARLRVLSFGGVAMENLSSALDPDAPPSRVGDIGNEVWDRYDVRIDLRRGWVELKHPSPSCGGKDRAAVRVGMSDGAR